MERVHRSGLDIDVALAAATRRSLAQNTARKQTPEPLARVEPPVIHNVMHTSMRLRAKRWLRRPVAVTFRLLKPFLRPLAFRTRRYLTEAMHNDTVRALGDTQREIQRVSAEVLREVQSAREMLRQELFAMQTQSSKEQRSLLTGLLQEQQAMRDLVRRLHIEGQQTIAESSSAAANLLAPQLERIVTESSSGAVGLLAPRLDRIELFAYASARRSVMHCAAGEMMVKTEAGYVMCSDNDLAVLACLADTGDLERGTRLLIQEVLQPGETFIDVGANVGIHTLAAGRALQGRGRIVAFEPFEATRKLLEKTIWINGLGPITEIHGSAVSDREGVQTLFLGASSGHHSLFKLDDTSSAQRVEVPTVTLASVLSNDQPIHLLKIDAEGAELDVLRGAVTVVRANPDIALIVEFGPSHLHRTSHGSAEWLAAFTDLGLEYRAIDPVSGTLGDVSLAELEAAESTNLFFARPGALPWSRTRKAA